MTSYWKILKFLLLISFGYASKISVEEKAAKVTNLTENMLLQLSDKCTTNVISFSSDFSDAVRFILRKSFAAKQIPFQEWNFMEDSKLGNVSWHDANCNLYLFVTEDLRFLHNILTKYDEEKWDYDGYMVIISGKMTKDDAGVAASVKILKLSSYVLLIGFTPNNQLKVYATNTNDGQTLTYVSKRILENNFTSTTFGDIFNRREANFGGNDLPIYSFHHPPSTFADLGEDGLLYNLTGIDIRGCEAVGLALNFRPKFIDVGPELWGKIYPNKTYSGIIGIISRGEGFLGVANIYINIRRTPYISYTAPYMQDRACLLTSSPRELPKWMSITLPFSIQVWIVFLVTIVFMTILTPTLYRLASEKSSMTELSGGFLFIISAYSNKSVSLPKDTALRLLVGFTMISAFVTTNYYSSKMTSLLTVTVTEKPLVSLRQIKEREIKIRGFGNTWYNLIAKSSNAIVRSLLPLLASYDDVNPLYQEVANGKMSLIGNERNMAYIEKMAIGEDGGTSPLRSMLEDCLAAYQVGAVMQKNSPYKAAVDSAIYRITAAGLIQKFHSEGLNIDRPADKIKIDLKKRTISGKNIQQFQPLTLQHVQGLFLLLLLGYMMALIAFGSELAIFVMKRILKAKK